MNARTEDLVRLNGAVQLGGGLLLALGVFPVWRPPPCWAPSCDHDGRAPVLGGYR